MNAEYNFKINGKWSISVVDQSGCEYFPPYLQDQNNLILNKALDVLSEGKFYAACSGINFNTIPAFLYADAVLGDGTGTPAVTDASLSNQTQISSGVRNGLCSTVDSAASGSRTFRKVYDFPFPITESAIREAGVRTPFGGTGLFSRFLLPTPLLLEPTQFARLYYDFTISCPAIVSGIPMTGFAAGTVNPSGSMKLCGTFGNIFGNMDADGNPIMVSGDSPRSSAIPYVEQYCSDVATCATTCYGTAYMAQTGVSFPAANTSLTTEWVGDRLEPLLGEVSGLPYSSGSFYRDVSYTFVSGNPSTSKDFGGFLFTVTKSNRQNTIDGWLWKFNANQTKLNTKQLVIVLRQSVSAA